MGHFDTKSEIEEYIRGLNIVSTIIHPSAFMEILTLPGMGLEKGEFAFFMKLDRPMQFIAVEDKNAFLGGLARLVDLGRLAGNADIALLRSQFPGLLTMDKWLAGAGKLVLLAAFNLRAAKSHCGEIGRRSLYQL